MHIKSEVRCLESESSMLNSPPSDLILLTSDRIIIFTPYLFASLTRQSMIVWDESVTGNILPSDSAFSFTPLSSNHFIVSVVKNWWKVFFTKFWPLGYCLLISAISIQAWVTLQRPPPLTFTFDNSLSLFSTTVTFNDGFILAAFTAQKIPAAPPPTTIKCLLTGQRKMKFY